MEAAAQGIDESQVTQPVLSLEELVSMQKAVAKISVNQRVQEYIVDLVEATRNNASIELGVSPRGMLLWQRMAQAWAMLQGRDFVTPSDVLQVAYPVLSVRLLATNGDVDSAIEQTLSTVAAPDYK